MTSELMLEILKSLQGQLALLRDDVGSIKGRLTSMDARMDARLAIVHTDIAATSERLDRIESRLERIDPKPTKATTVEAHAQKGTHDSLPKRIAETQAKASAPLKEAKGLGG